MCICRPHSYPQSNFLLKSRGGSYIFDSRIKVLGDLKELAGVLRLADFQCDKSIPVDHNASESDVKAQFFPRLLSSLSNQTMEELCNYIALDFYRLTINHPFFPETYLLERVQ